jgi:hypothetical protein
VGGGGSTHLFLYFGRSGRLLGFLRGGGLVLNLIALGVHNRHHLGLNLFLFDLSCHGQSIVSNPAPVDFLSAEE